MPGLNKLFFSSCVLLALLSIWGCGGGDGGHAPLDTGPVGQDLQDAISRLSSEDSDADTRLEAVADFVKAGDLRGVAFLKSFREGQSIYRWKDRLVLVEKFDSDADGNSSARLFDHILRTELNGGDGKQVVAAKSELKEVSASRGLRRPVLAAEDTLKLGARDEKTCQQAAQKCGNSRRAEFLLPLEALGADPSRSGKTRRVARTGVCLIKISGNVSGLPEQEVLDAVKELGVLCSEAGAAALKELSSKAGVSPALAAACGSSIASIDSYQSKVRNLSHVFNGISAGSVLILMALGLSIIFGLMGVINMAHGEFIMMGAYTGFVVQLFVPDYTLSILIALPLAFAVTFGAGVAMERLVIRHLYHRPLETLLATFGISIALQQLAKNIFGTQARPLTSPAWLDGALVFNDVIAISYIRIAIFVMALIFLGLILYVLNRTRLGLEVRAVTQNSGMAASMGINPDRINMLTFGLGSGIAGIAGVAIGLYAKVTSEMGADYIVQSFMTVVVGGVGNVWGTLAGASLIGFLQKGIEWLNPSNTLAAQTYMILFIILFIQFRPKGIVAQKGRAAAD